MSHDPPDIFTRIYVRHGHRCPMSTLGGRLGLAALKWLGDCDGELQAVYSNRTCATDGIAETTGCTEEKGSLIVKNDGRHALTLSSAQASVEVELTAEALEMAGRYRSLCNRLEKGWDELEAGEQVKRRAVMDAMLDELLPQFWQAEDQKLLQKNSKD
ncbi:MAG TPA: formylmethanofuran dehydrogenase subunit E family protein [Desulfuromonadales bacterium]|nr:formylmethanofuran dehydrogenase subunit E family protein [Desulfuromonadales bacterium]